MGYNNDQFFRYSDGGGTVGNGQSWVADNPPFLYPERVVRGMDAQGRYRATPLKRGYIRSLVSGISSPGMAADVPIRKCQFQFNPMTLQQTVSMSQSVLDWLHLSPAQFAQPIPGMANFAFQMMFDRSMELNNPRNFKQIGGAEQDGVEGSPWDTADPSRVGVLRDVATLYSVIGQGVSHFQDEYQRAVQERAMQMAVLEANRDEDSSQEKLDKVAGNIEDVLGQVNVGNYAFLIPMPVRVVFSSLYMVEGLVSTSDITFTKFTTHMVPMQATVTLAMEAKYMGFLKKNTFFQANLDEAARAQYQEIQDEVDKVSTLFSSVAVGAFGNQYGEGGIFYAGGKSAQDLIDEGFGGVGHCPVLLDGETDPVKGLFTAGSNVSIDMASQLRVYGPYGEAQLNPILNTPYQFSINEQLFGGGVTSQISTAADWDKLLKFDKDLSFNAEGGYLDASKAPVPGVAESYVAVYDMQVAVTVDGRTVSGTASLKRSYGSGVNIATSGTILGLEFVDETGSTDTSMVISGNLNPSTSSPPPNSPSTYGGTVGNRQGPRDSGVWRPE